MSRGPKAISVREDGTPDGWTPTPGYLRDVDASGQTRLVISVPHGQLAGLHQALAATLASPVSVLYRQLVDRRTPRPQGAPPQDHVGVDRPLSAVLSALETFAELLYHDARHELWLKGGMGEQLVLDADGLMYAYPDDPVFTDVLAAHGVPADLGETLVDRDYARHAFHADLDVLEDGLIATLALVAMPTR